MDKINRVKQSIQGMLKKMKQDKDNNQEICSTAQDQAGRSFQKKALVKTSSMKETLTPPEVKQTRRAVSECDRHTARKRNTPLEKGNEIVDIIDMTQLT